MSEAWSSRLGEGKIASMEMLGSSLSLSQPFDLMSQFLWSFVWGVCKDV